MAQLNDLLVRGDSNLLGALNVFEDVTAPNFIGNASSATKLAAAKKIQVNLGNNTIATFDGSADITTGVTGTLRIVDGGTGMSTNPSLLVNLASETAATIFQTSPRPGISGVLGATHGGTGQNTLNKSANALINALEVGTSNPTDNDYYVAQYAGGGTTNTNYYRRPVSALYNYIKGKLDDVYIQKGTGKSDFVNVTGDTMTGTLYFNNGVGIVARRTTSDNESLKIITEGNNGNIINNNETAVSRLYFTLKGLDSANNGASATENVIQFLGDKNGSEIIATKFTGTNLHISDTSYFGNQVVISAGPNSNYNAGLRILPSTSGWGYVFFSNDTSTSGTHDKGWIVGKRGSAGTVGAAGDFLIQEQGSDGAGGMTVHQNNNGATLYGLLRLRGETGIELYNTNASITWPTATGTPVIKPNSVGSYGALMINAIKGNYHGILLGSGKDQMTLMSSNPHQGLYNESKSRWILYYNYTNDRVAIATSSCEGYDITLGGSTYIRGATTVNGTLKINPDYSLYIAQTAGNGAGISLYGDGGPSSYGIFFAKTANFGKYGDVQSDWATYFSMNDTAQRGWVFRKASTNIASLSNGGNLTLNGYVKIANKVRLEYATATESLEFIFD